MSPISFTSTTGRRQYRPLVVALAKESRTKKLKTVFTIHNIEYQGRCTAADLKKIGLKEDKNLQDPYSKTLMNLLKGAIVYSDFVTTVSPKPTVPGK